MDWVDQVVDKFESEKKNEKQKKIEQEKETEKRKNEIQNKWAICVDKIISPTLIEISREFRRRDYQCQADKEAFTNTNTGAQLVRNLTLKISMLSTKPRAKREFTIRFSSADFAEEVHVGYFGLSSDEIKPSTIPFEKITTDVIENLVKKFVEKVFLRY